MCGADKAGAVRAIRKLGSSPRVRSGHIDEVYDQSQRGIISACAERTRLGAMRYARTGDHLRVCGADATIPDYETAVKGSSPRVRSGLRNLAITRPPVGIISACAERTSFPRPLR